jgi:hypothetical protein
MQRRERTSSQYLRQLRSQWPSAHTQLVENFSNSLRGLCDVGAMSARFRAGTQHCQGLRRQDAHKSGISHKLFETLTFQDQNIAPRACGESQTQFSRHCMYQ